MTLVNARAAFEKAITDAVNDADSKVKLSYDNTHFTTPGKSTKHVKVSVSFSQAVLQNQGASSDYYAGSIRCDIYTPKSAGSAALAAISEAVIDGMISVNASGYTDTFSCKPRVSEVVGPIPITQDDRSHFLGIVTCAFSANA